VAEHTEVEAFAAATRRSRRIKLGVLIGLVLSPLIWVIYKNVAVRDRIAKREEAYQESIRLTDADKASLRAELPVLRKQVDESAHVFVTTVTPAALEALEDSGSRCRYRVDATRVPVYPPGAQVQPSVGYELSTIDEITKELTAGTADKEDVLRVERMRYGMDQELFIIGERREPVVLDDSFMPGQVTGFVYLYSHEAKRIVCFAALAVQNTAAIDIEYRAMAGNILDEAMKKREAAQHKLATDLTEQLRLAITARLQSTL
jgi:hypothetical protein